MIKPVFCSIFLFVLSLQLLSQQAFTQSRQVVSLNSGWKFTLNDSSSMSSLSNANWQPVNLPHTWNALDIIDEVPGYHQGIGWYKKALSFPDSSKHVELFFEGVCNKTEVYVNSKKVVVHYGGFTGFRADITPFIHFGNALNTVLVKADNGQYLRDSVPPFSADFNLMGGIYRDVWVVTTNPIHFSGSYGSKGVFFETPSVSESSADFVVRGNVDANHSNDNLQVVYELYDHNEILKRDSVQINGSTSSFNIKGSLHHPHLWSPEDPHLYRLKVTLLDDSKKICDELVIPTGFKWVAIGKDEQFFLNGKPYKLRGAARHQDFDHLGTAMTDPMHTRDMELMKAMGCNFIRIAHYPQDPAIYEACDRLGIIAWNEIPVVDRVVDNPVFLQRCAEMMHEMIFQNFNHPSIAIWGFQNEIRNLDTADLRNARMMDSIARHEDPRRLTAMAFETNLNAPFFKNPLLSQALGIPDIIGYNIYQGWYRTGLETIGSFLDTLHQLNPSKPILISEYGAGSSIHIHSFHPHLFDFSEEYQCDFQAPYLDAGNKRSWMIGFAIWNFIDFQRDGREDVQPGYNNKGMVTTSRAPKDVYYLYQSRWTNTPFIYIAGKHWQDRFFVTGGAHHVTMPVTIYSNLQQVQLFHNGKGLTVTNAGHGKFTAMASAVEGQNQFLCKGADGKIADLLNIHCTFLDTLSFSKKFPVQGINFNTGQTTSFFEDAVSHQTWIPDKPYSKGSWGYVGGNVFDSWPNSPWNGIRQGIGKPIALTDNEPVYQTFVQGLTAWKADLPAGTYRITVLFSEPFTSSQRKKEDRVFDVLLNGQPWIEKLNLENQFGIQRAVSFDKIIDLKANEGLTIQFTGHSGVTLLNGVSIYKLY